MPLWYLLLVRVCGNSESSQVSPPLLLARIHPPSALPIAPPLQTKSRSMAGEVGQLSQPEIDRMSKVLKDLAAPGGTDPNKCAQQQVSRIDAASENPGVFEKYAGQWKYFAGGDGTLAVLYEKALRARLAAQQSMYAHVSLNLLYHIAGVPLLTEEEQIAWAGGKNREAGRATVERIRALEHQAKLTPSSAVVQVRSQHDQLAKLKHQHALFGGRSLPAAASSSASSSTSSSASSSSSSASSYGAGVEVSVLKKHELKQGATYICYTLATAGANGVVRHSPITQDMINRDVSGKLLNGVVEVGFSAAVTGVAGVAGAPRRIIGALRKAISACRDPSPELVELIRRLEGSPFA